VQSYKSIKSLTLLAGKRGSDESVIGNGESVIRASGTP